VRYRLHYPGKEATMLILTRRVGETIAIETPAGERVEVAVLGVKGNQVRVDTPGARRCRDPARRVGRLATHMM
jgi:hypothetical protein